MTPFISHLAVFVQAFAFGFGCGLANAYWFGRVNSTRDTDGASRFCFNVGLATGVLSFVTGEVCMGSEQIYSLWIATETFGISVAIPVALMLAALFIHFVPGNFYRWCLDLNARVIAAGAKAREASELEAELRRQIAEERAFAKNLSSIASKGSADARAAVAVIEREMQARRAERSTKPE